MSYFLEPDESVAEGARRIAQEQLAKAHAEIDDAALGVHETIHQVRKRCKKLRGLVRLIRPAVPKLYKRENKIFRDAARTVSDARDATACLETYDALTAHYAEEIDRRAFGPIRAALTRRRTRLMKAQDIGERLTAFRETLAEAQERVRGWDVPEDGYDAVRGGLRKTYKRARKRQAKAYDDPSPERFHEWRKRAKYHRYHMRLLRDLWRPVVNARRYELHDLTDALGHVHDLAELRRVIEEEPEAFRNLEALEAFLGLMDRRRAELRARVRPLGQRAFAEKPDAFVKRFGRYWKAWQAEADRAAALAAVE